MKKATIMEIKIMQNVRKAYVDFDEYEKGVISVQFTTCEPGLNDVTMMKGIERILEKKSYASNIALLRVCRELGTTTWIVKTESDEKCLLEMIHNIAFKAGLNTRFDIVESDGWLNTLYISDTSVESKYSNKAYKLLANKPTSYTL